MTPRKYSLLVHLFSYSGNGATPSTSPDVYQWLMSVIPQIKQDPRIERVMLKDVADTPITMTRNQAVVAARECGADLLLMVDSDMKPDMYVGLDPEAKPFWDEAFNFIDANYDRGPSVVAAPYCGPPPYEMPYVFYWHNTESEHAGLDHRLEMYSRSQAASMSGIQPAAALPTGLILFDMRAFLLTEPKPSDIVEQLAKPWVDRIGSGTVEFTAEEITELVAQVVRYKTRKSESWFYYEYLSPFCDRKGSTEDVTATRDMSLIGQIKLGYNPIFCAWSSWAGHWKPKCVGKPMMIDGNSVNDKMRQAILADIETGTKVMEVNCGCGDSNTPGPSVC